MLRITFPYLLLISLTAFSGSILNTYDKFAVPAFTPVLLNIVLWTYAHPVSSVASF
jgi:putative peptidoglycan lipid II flippase